MSVLDDGRYITQILHVPQEPVDNQNNVVVVYDKQTKLCACSNKYNSSLKNRKHCFFLIERQIQIIELGDNY